MAATDDVKTVVETLSGSTKTATQLTNIGNAIAALSLDRGRIVLKLEPIHFDGDGIPLDFATLTNEQKAELVLAALKKFGRIAVYVSKYADELETAEGTVASTAETAAADFD